MATRVVEISLTEAELDAAKTGRKLGYKEGLLEAAGMAEAYGSNWGLHDVPDEWKEFAARLRSKASE